MKKFFKIGLTVIIITILLTICIGGYIYFMLPNAGDAPKLIVERTPERVERGRYLANNVTVCMDCHSTREWDKFAGPMATIDQGGGGEIFNQDMGFPGTFYAPNITPYALNNWTDGELLRAITTGVNNKGKALFPVMGYHRFGKMDKEDVYSIIKYIRTLEPIKKDIPKSTADFPVNILINTMPVAADYQRIPSEADEVNYGAYLANAAGCVECHSKMDKGKIVAGTEYGGGMEFNLSGILVRSPNITPDNETGIGGWTKKSFTERFKMYSGSRYNPASVKPGEMNTPMPWNMYAGMRESDLEAIYSYLKSLKPIENKVARFEKR